MIGCLDDHDRRCEAGDDPISAREIRTAGLMPRCELGEQRATARYQAAT